MHDQYFQGILQLRNPTPEVVDFVDNSGCEISRVKKVPNGFDFYFASQRVLRSLGKELQRRFPGQLKSTRRLFSRSRQTSKDIYRVTVLFRSFNIKKGDELVVKAEPFKVLVASRKIFVQNQKTGEKKWLSYDRLPNHFREA